MNTRPCGPRNNPTKDVCLLARFSDAETGRLKVYYVPRGLRGRREYDNPPSRAGRVLEYMRFCPQEHEDGGEVENHLPAAFAAIDDGTILDHPGLVSVLKDCIALRWARSAAYKQAHEERFRSVTEQQKRESPLLPTATDDQAHTGSRADRRVALAGPFAGDPA